MVAWRYDAMTTSSTKRGGCRWFGRGDILHIFTDQVKALVWFWIIDETLVLTSILSVYRLNEVGTCQVMEQVMIMAMIMMVMTTR